MCRTAKSPTFAALQATDDEVVVFSWVEWPDKANAAMGKMEVIRRRTHE